MKALTRLSVLLCLLFPIFSSAKSLKATIRSALHFIEQDQATGNTQFDAGQWPTYVTSTFPDFVGVGKYGVPYPEPSAFAAGSVANILAEIYHTDKSHSRIPSMLEKAMTELEPYQVGPVYHFYPQRLYRGIVVRGPRSLDLDPAFDGFVNIPPDADTTSVTYLMKAHLKAIQQGTNLRESSFALPRETLNQFATYRDHNRGSGHIYNELHSMSETGAFLTWLWDEQNPKMPRDFFATPDKGARIPFSTNDVDCVVNANVIKLLTVARQTHSPGYKEACSLLNEITEKQNFYSCGMYYPSHYILPYSMASAMDMGASCLMPSRRKLIDFILRNQQEDGSWVNYPSTADRVQSTAWALNTLLILGYPEYRTQQRAAAKAIQFLLSKVRISKNGNSYWPGEIFYAGVFIARRTVVWRSNSYTTASVVRALVLADKKWKLTL